MGQRAIAAAESWPQAPASSAAVQRLSSALELTPLDSRRRSEMDVSSRSGFPSAVRESDQRARLGDQSYE